MLFRVMYLCASRKFPCNTKVGKDIRPVWSNGNIKHNIALKVAGDRQAKLAGGIKLHDAGMVQREPKLISGTNHAERALTAYL